ncbi:glucosamine-6-phosphate deaminase [Ferruginibacter paludis]|uniref:glucosamine-6-phosphate deaminase n=1 Tax=Ferruginibacter paludis TaxID=1310417 RepID=UPI0025B38CF0|nr:glucosamine-6-phosphate deaminase [Ferruginibacter paludis]MDN3656814.1 glucosamine-6-phosphate deaminase [Ferruginibacter paludis]
MTRKFTTDKLQTKIYASRTAMGEAAAGAVIARINELLTSRDVVNIIFAAAPSQNEFLAALTNSILDWSRVRAFHMDEYIGLHPDAPQGFGNFLKEKLFNKLPFAAVHYLNGNDATPSAKCKRYAALLQQYPVDIVCMGIGENGHLAFNDPPVADFNDAQLVKIVELDQACRQQQVNDGCFATIGLVPTHAITLTIPALMAAPFIYCMVPGPTKAVAVFNTLHQDILELYPSTVLRRHNNAVLYLDGLSSGKL